MIIKIFGYQNNSYFYQIWKIFEFVSTNTIVRAEEKEYVAEKKNFYVATIDISSTKN